jgi:hypothetical protein
MAGLLYGIKQAEARYLDGATFRGSNMGHGLFAASRKFRGFLA